MKRLRPIPTVSSAITLSKHVCFRMSYLFTLYHVTDKRVIAQTKELMSKAEQIPSLAPVQEMRVLSLLVCDGLSSSVV